MSSRVRVFGIGSPHGDDQAGWHVAHILQERTAVPATVVRHPLDLCDVISGCRHAVIVDSCVRGGEVGSVVGLNWPDDRIASKSRGSTHGVDVDFALRLAEQLGNFPEEITLLLIEIAACDPGGKCSSAIVAAASNLADQIECQWQRADE